MRVLCSTTPMDGAFGPFIPLGRALSRSGHDVLVATGSNLRSRVLENGLEFVECGLSAMDGVVTAWADPYVKEAPEGDRIRFPAVMFGAVHPGAKLKPKLGAGRVANRRGAEDGPRGTVKGSQHAVAERLDRAAAEAPELPLVGS